MDETTANRIEKILGKQYAGSVRLYQFPIEKCKELKAYKLLEENKSESSKQLLKKIEVEVEPKDSMFKHLIEKKYKKLFFNTSYVKGKQFQSKPKSIKESVVSAASAVPFVPFEPEIDFNALAIISHKIAEKFARDSGDFEVGPLKDTEIVEFHTYATINSKQKLGELNKHIDDKGGVSYNTITMIWYLIKDKEVDGGNIIFSAPYPQHGDKPWKYWEYLHKHRVEPPDREVKINLWEQMDDARENCVCLIFKGNVWHSPEPMGGTGERSAIVFQFVRIDKPAKRGGKIKKTRKTKK